MVIFRSSGPRSRLANFTDTLLSSGPSPAAAAYTAKSSAIIKSCPRSWSRRSSKRQRKRESRQVRRCNQYGCGLSGPGGLSGPSGSDANNCPPSQSSLLSSTRLTTKRPARRSLPEFKRAARSWLPCALSRRSRR